jgi:methylthioribose-1-phosphate isomerase
MMPGAAAEGRPTPPSTPEGAVPTVAWKSGDASGIPGAVELLDQTRLPETQVALRCGDVAPLIDAIRRLVVRGAPAIGVAGAYGVVLAAQEAKSPAAFRELCRKLREARPTAVNLAWAVDRTSAADPEGRDPRRLLAAARRIHAEDEAACAAMGRHGATLLREGGTYLTHCNTGRLAATGIGTALGVLVTAHAWGLRPKVYVGEVRPLLQGARLTAFELQERGMDGVLMPDTAAGALLASGRIDGVLVGADRIAANGDTANKIGTYALAELARANGVPFWVVAPTSTIDPSIADGTSIPIEERAPEEVRGWRKEATSPAGFPVWNPAFDVTPARLVSALVTERGVLRPPFELRRTLSNR